MVKKKKKDKVHLWATNVKHKKTKAAALNRSVISTPVGGAEM